MGRPEQVEEPSSAAVKADGGERLKVSPLARRIAREDGVDLSSLSGSGPGGRIVKADVEAAGSAQVGAAHEAAVTPGAPASAPTAARGGDAAPQDVRTAKGQTTTEPLTRMQQTIARRMAESKATIPDFALQADRDMEVCVR